MKTEVYTWRLSSDRKAALEEEARREGISLSELLERASANWLLQRRNGHSSEEAEQAAIRRRAATAIGSVGSGDSGRSARTSEQVREVIHNKHLKESNAFPPRNPRRYN